MRKTFSLGLILAFSLVCAQFSAMTPYYEEIEEPPPIVSLSDYTPHSPVSITSDDDFETQGWPGNGTSEAPYLITNLQIGEDGFHAISVENTRVPFIVNGCSLYAGVGTHGIAFNNVSNSVIHSNNFSGNSDHSMRLLYSENITIRNNTCIGQRGGVDTYECSNFLIENNTISTSMQAALHLQLINNVTVLDNFLDGGLTDRGLSFEDVDNCTVRINEISYVRIYLDVSNTSLSYNKFHSENGFDITGSPLSYFDYNFYTTYGGSDNDRDDIGDTPFVYDSSSFDLHPLMYWPWVFPDTTPPTIDSPSDYEYEEFSTGHSITWNPFDENPQNYTIYKDSSPVKSGPWNSTSENITVSIDGLSKGTYNITIIVKDMANNTATDQVDVTVMDQTKPIIDEPEDFQYDEFTTGHSITWSPSDAHPSSYIIYHNRIQNRSGLWNSSTEFIIMSVDSLELGVHNFTLVVFDESGNNQSDSVFVTVVDGSNPLIDAPSDIEYEEFTEGHLIIWNPSDPHPLSYVVYLNDTPEKTGIWNSSSEDITVSADGLGLGVHNFTVVVTDVGNNNASDQVLVTVVDGTAPLIDSPSDIEYDEFTTGHSITWNPTDLHPAFYEVYRNDTQIIDTPWYGDSIPVNIDGLGLGTYIYTIEVIDIGGNSATDEVYVHVRDGTPPEVNDAPDIAYTEGESGNFIAWLPTDLHPASYEVLLDGIQLQSGAWNLTGESISISVDGHSAGIYNYTIIVTDVGDNMANDTVLVTVSEVQTTTTTTITTTTTTTQPTTNGTTTPSGDGLTSMIIVIVGIGGSVIIIVIIVILKGRTNSSEV